MVIEVKINRLSMGFRITYTVLMSKLKLIISMPW